MKYILLFLLTFCVFGTQAQLSFIPTPCTLNSFTVPALGSVDFFDTGGPGGDTCASGAAGNYPNSACITEILFTAPAGEQVHINFAFMSMYNTTDGWDWMIIYDGPNNTSPILFDNSFGGPDQINHDDPCQVNPGEIFCSTGTQLFIEFFATSVVDRAGWEAVVATCSMALPVELLEFDADCSYATWSTASKSNSSHFLVETSSDGYFWETEVHVPAAGNSSSVLYYKAPLRFKEGLHYY